MYTTLAIFGLVILAQITKGYIKPRFGDTGVHVFVFLVSISMVLIHAAMTFYPGFGKVLVTAGDYFAGAITLYQVVIKQLSSNVNLPKDMSEQATAPDQSQQ